MSNWPSVSYEELPWPVLDHASGTASRATLRQHRGRYRAAVVPEIGGQEVLLPAALGAAVEDASLELARFDAELGAEIAPFSAVLLRSESAASSKIENLTASARAIAEAELGGGRRNAQEIVANTRAMTAALALSDRLDAAAILEMHRALREVTNPAIAGRWRPVQVWIGGSDDGPHRAEFVPPQHSRVERAIQDLVTFINRDDLPVLVQAALAHAQFETIHPFEDGNGRIGRALLQAMFRNKSLTRKVTVPVSAGLLSNTGSYFTALTAYREGEVTPIIERVIDASFAAVANGRLLAAELKQIRRSWSDRVTARKDSRVWEVADLILRHPVLNAALLTSALGVQPSNAYPFLDRLVESGVLTPCTSAGRTRAWRSDEVLRALDAFADRAGRRAPGQPRVRQ